MHSHTVYYSTHPGSLIIPAGESGEDGRSILRSAVVLGDALDVLATLPEGLVRTAVTSPPYWSLRDYSFPGQIGLEDDPDEYVASLVRIFDEVRRVLTKDGSLWLNIGDSYTSGGRTWRASDKKNPARAMTTRPPTPKGLKPKELVGIPWRLAFALQASGWYLRSDVIWCLSGGARVYARTRKGEMPMTVKDLVRLDPSTVELWNGEKWTRVSGFSRSAEPRDGSLEIELRSGERIGCTPGHLWPTGRGNTRAGELQVGDVISTCRLPQPSEPAEADALDEEVGWLCGLYLAEGSMSGDTVQIAAHADQSAERSARLERSARRFHGSARVHLTGKNTATINLAGPVIASVVRAYVHGESAANKGIQVRAWQRDDSFLIAVLRGYLEGDAHYDEADDRYRLGFTRNDRLAADLRTLAARLGLPLTLKATTVAGFGKEWPAYRGDIRLAPVTHFNARKMGQVVAIRGSRARRFWDIGVEDEPHLFALASGVLAHNSKPNAMPESVKDRPTRSHEYLFLFTKSERYYYDRTAVTEANGRNLRTVWDINTRPFPEAHFAIFPTELVARCVRTTSKSGDIVLDPFLGSRTVAEVAIHNQRAFLGIEINPEYVEITRRRISRLGGRLDQWVEEVG